MGISTSDIQTLRQKTGAGLMAAKKALEESGGDIEKAMESLRKKGMAKAAERGERTTGEGVVASYIHGNNKLGTLVEVRCETDFVARTPEFGNLARDLAMHVAAANPLYISPEEIPGDVLEKEREIIQEQMSTEGIPEKARDNALKGKVEKYYAEVCLLKQSFVKDPSKTIQELVTETATKTGENIQVVRFSRLSI